MTYTITITEAQVFTAIRNWLLNAVAGEIVQGWENRVATPSGGFVVMSGLVKQRLSTNETSYPDDATESNTQSIDYHIQLDAYGSNAGDWAAILTTAYRSDQACTFFASQLPGLAPLYMEDARQSPLVTGEQQYESRWTMVIHLQYKPSISDAQASAATVTAGIINVEAVYPA